MAFRNVFTSKRIAVGTKLDNLSEANAVILKKYPSGLDGAGTKVDFDELLGPHVDDVSKALDEMLETAHKYYRALPAMIDNKSVLKKLYLEPNTDGWMKVGLSRFYNLKKTPDLTSKVRKIENLVHDARSITLAKLHNLPVTDHVLARFWKGLGKTGSGSKDRVAKYFNTMMATNQKWGDNFWRTYTEKNVARIEDVIYNKIPNSKSTSEIHYYLDEISQEMQAMRKNAVQRNTTAKAIFNSDNLAAVKTNNKDYLLEISRVGRQLDSSQASNARVFGVWGNDVYDEVVKWEKKTGKTLPVGFDGDIDVRDALYNLQEYCKGISC